jgi:hypothetical protein
MLITFLVFSLHFLAYEESQINVDYYGYIMVCLQQLSRLIGRALNDLHDQENILFYKEREVTGTINWKRKLGHE